MKPDADLLLRFHEGSLSDAERAAVESLLASDDAAALESQQIAAMRSGLRAGRPDGFKPFFSERVLRQIRPQESADVSMYLALRWAFVRASAVACVVAIVLAGLNAGAYAELDVTASFVDSMFGIPDASPLDAWTYTGTTSDLP
jgi:anti-sigma factor RsiW